MRGQRLGRTRLFVLFSVLSVAVASGGTPAAGLLSGGLVGGTLDTTKDTLGSVVSIVSPGWDDGATTPPVSLDTAAEAIGADQLQDSGFDGTGIDVAVIDTGMVPVDGLVGPGKVVNGPDLSFESQSDDLRHLDAYGHGTHMAGIIAGNSGIGRNFRGIAPGARLVNIRVGTHDGAVDVTQVIAAIDWVVQHKTDAGMNIRVLNLSYGTDSLQDPRLDPLSHAVEVAWRNGITVVSGGGNDGSSRPALISPAINPYVIAVGAADLQNTPTFLDDTVAPFSSLGSSSRRVDVVAPGVSITSLRVPGSTIDDEHPTAVVDERFFRGSGTSQAAAVTSGAVALLLDARPTLTPDQVKHLLRSTATWLPNASSRAQGAGRLDVASAALDPVSLGSAQSWPRSYGTGSVEKARGTSHVADDGVELQGEQDIFGQPWNGKAWAAAASARTSWNGGRWNGSDWTGECWCSTSWSGTSWTGRTWIGNSWTGRTWIGRTWIGRTWIGRTWIGEGWNGASWTGRTWVGRTWVSS